MKVVLDIQDNKAAAFLNFIESLDFIRINIQEEDQEPTKQEVLDSIQRGMKEAQLYQEGKTHLSSAKDFLHEL